MAGPRDDLVHRAHADDLAQRARDFGARAAAQELAHRLAGAQKLPGQVDIDDGFPLRQRHFVERRVALQPGIGDNDVERAKGRAGFLEHLGDLRLARHVGAQRHRAAAHRSDQVGDFMGFVLAGDVVDDDRRAGLGQRDRHRLADPRIGAGDQRLLPGKRSGRPMRAARRISACSLISIATSDLPCIER